MKQAAHEKDGKIMHFVFCDKAQVHVTVCNFSFPSKLYQQSKAVKSSNYVLEEYLSKKPKRAARIILHRILAILGSSVIHQKTQEE